METNRLDKACDSFVTFGRTDAEARSTGLIQATRQHHTQCASGLIQLEADVNASDTRDAPIMLLVAQNGLKQTVQELTVARADVNKCDRNKVAPIPIVMQHDQSDCNNQRLLTAGADVNAADGNGTTPLMFASSKDQHHCVCLLIEQGADVNASDNMGRTALMFAVNRCHLECTETLLKAGADVNSVDTYGYTPLLSCIDYASSKDAARNPRFLQCLKCLLRSGAHVNKRVTKGLNEGMDGLSILLSRAKYSQTRGAILLLLAAGEMADENTVTSFGLKMPKLNLQHSCRQTIRKHLLDINAHLPLFKRVTELGLPASLADYLVHNVSLL